MKQEVKSIDQILLDRIREMRDKEDKDFCVIASVLGIPRLAAILLYAGERK